MNIKNVWKTDALLCALAFLFLSFRSSESETVDGGEMSLQHPIVLFLSNYSIIGAILILSIMATRTILSNNIGYIPPYIYMYGFGLAFYNVRIIETNGILNTAAGVYVALLFTVLAGVQVTLDKANYKRLAVFWGGYIFCLIFSAINLYLYIFGMGFFKGTFRFSGVSYHPNQFGAIAAIVTIYMYTVSASDIFHGKAKIINIFSTLISLFLVMASASRGALLGVVVALIFRSLCLRINLVGLFGGVVIAYSTYLIFINSSGNGEEIIDRFNNTGDNRSDVLLSLINYFFDSPLIGMGPEAQGSENAILKALAIGGVMCGVPVIIYTGSVLKRLILSANRYMSSINNNILDVGMDSVVFLILFSSIFDGYLFEKLGFATFFILMVNSTFGVNSKDFSGD